MPSTYAHYKFGQDVLGRLPEQIVKQMSPYMPLYNIGLHGPDLLFYYKPLEKNVINEEGSIIHDRPGYVFFDKARSVIQKSKEGSERQERLAYIYGCICHFALDSICHGYIDEKIAESGIGHVEIEVEFDRFLLEQNGKDPMREDLAKHIDVSEGCASTIAPYYNGTTTKDIKKAMVSMKRYIHFLMMQNKSKRFFVYSVLKVAGCYEKMKELLMSEQPNPNCRDSNEKLSKLYEESIMLGVKLIVAFEGGINREVAFSEDYTINFNGVREEIQNGV